MEIGGWCPSGGWAEDYPEAPGLMADYLELVEIRLADPAQRTEWNVRDSDATLVIAPRATTGVVVSPGTGLTLTFADKYDLTWLNLVRL